jgi:adenylosuccinate synthase
MQKMTMVLDMQFGSTGKGLIAGALALDNEPDTLITAWAPNAGHTFINREGRKWVHRMVPNGIVSPKLKRIMIGPGSLIDLKVLREELKASHDLIADRGVAVYIHGNAGVVLPRHVEAEAGPMQKIGSTKKGVGAAAIERIQRDPEGNNTVHNLTGSPLMDELQNPFDPQLPNIFVVGTGEWMRILINDAEAIQVEGAQGFSLSIHHGFYPWCTSRDVSFAQTMADCGIPTRIRGVLEIIGTARTYPIRVANRDGAGPFQPGWSGPGYPDQKELQWHEVPHRSLGDGITVPRDVELTTVTQLPRRIFNFSREQIKQALMYTAAGGVFLNFANYCANAEELMRIVDVFEEEQAEVKWFGFGPTVEHVVPSCALIHTTGKAREDVFRALKGDR